MKFTIVVIIFLHFWNIDISFSDIFDCNYINNKTESVELQCTYINLTGFLRNRDTEKVQSNSTQESRCYYDLFKSDSKEKNRQNVDILNPFNCGLHTYKEYFKNFTYLNHSYTPEAYLMHFIDLDDFNNMPNLLEIDFSNNKIMIIVGSIVDEEMQISVFNVSNNWLRALHEIIFARMTKLKILDLSFNSISTIEVNTFRNNKHLEVLLLHNNPLTAFDCNVFTPMKNLVTLTATLDIIDRITLDCVGCSISNSVNNTDVVEIRLPGVKSGIFFNKNNLTNWRQFSMQNSGIILKTIRLVLPSSLVVLDISSNNLNGHSVNIFERFTNLEELNLSRTNLTNLNTGLFLKQNELKLLDLSFNNLTVRNATALFEPLQNLQMLNMVGAHLQNTAEIIQSLPTTVIRLDLSHNYLGALNASTFQRFTNLQHLNLSHTHLSNFGFNTFYHQTKLRSLDISYNTLKTVDFTLFARIFRDLTELYLEGNSLTDLNTITPSIFPNMSVLTISKNQLSCSSLAQFLHQWKNLKLIANPSNQTYMSGIDCNLVSATEEISKVASNSNGKDIPTKQDIIVIHTESHVTKYSVLFLCVMCCGYLLVKSKLIPRIKDKLARNLTSQQATSTFPLIVPETI